MSHGSVLSFSFHFLIYHDSDSFSTATHSFDLRFPLALGALMLTIDGFLFFASVQFSSFLGAGDGQSDELCVDMRLAGVRGSMIGFVPPGTALTSSSLRWGVGVRIRAEFERFQSWHFYISLSLFSQDIHCIHLYYSRSDRTEGKASRPRKMGSSGRLAGEFGVGRKKGGRFCCCRLLWDITCAIAPQFRRCV